MNEDYKYWVAMVSATMWVFNRHKSKGYVERFTITAISAGMGLSLDSDLAAYTGRSDLVSGTAIILSVWILLDLAASITADRASIKEAIMKRISGGGK